MITIRSLTEDIILKEFTINLTENKKENVNEQKEEVKDENNDDNEEMVLYEFIEYHNGYLYVQIDEDTPMRNYDVN